MNSDDPKTVGCLLGGGTLLVAAAITVGMVGCPMYNVYEQEKAGEAELKKAESSRRIAVLEAQAKMDSAKLLAEAEIERAKGISQANAIIGDSLKGKEEYLRWLFIEQLKDSNTQVIYVPTEANLPILEARKP